MLGRSHCNRYMGMKIYVKMDEIQKESSTVV